MPAYLVVCGGKTLEAPDFAAALSRAAGECSDSAVILRGEVIARLGAEELHSLRAGGAVGAAAAGAQRPWRGQGASQAASLEAAGEAEVAVVFDQMYKTFAEILERELRDLPLVFHEILGRGIDRPVKVSQRIYQQPARDDYDVLKLLEQLAQKHRLVIFFTGDKRLANQARSIEGVHVEYLPPGEAPGKEQALKLMARRIREILSGRA